jgi:hypothetical protein
MLLVRVVSRVAQFRVPPEFNSGAESFGRISINKSAAPPSMSDTRQASNGAANREALEGEFD